MDWDLVFLLIHIVFTYLLWRADSVFLPGSYGVAIGFVSFGLRFFVYIHFAVDYLLLFVLVFSGSVL